MVSSTRQTTRRRAINTNNAGRAAKRRRAKASTPAFPVHPEGYAADAPDAKKSNS